MSKTVQIPILLPKMGESVSEATIIEWFKKPGDKIERDELFVLIGTDKVESELPSEFEGILTEILIPEKGEVEVGKPICIIEVDENQVSKTQLQQQQSVQKETQTQESVKINSYKGSKKFLSPVVRKIATDAGLELSDLENIQGTGESGRISKKDILKYLNKDKVVSTAQFTPEKLNLKIDKDDKVSSLTRMQKLLAAHLQQSFNEIPHVTTFAEADVTEIVAHREAQKDSFFQKFNTKITYTHYFQFAIISALKEFPLLNAWMNVDEIIEKTDINLGFAAALANGDLIVPNVKSAQQMTFNQWVTAVNDMAQKAKTGKLSSDDVQHTTFSVSNTGMFGSLAGTPIISKPQVAIVALGEINSAPGVVQVDGIEQVAVRKKMMLSISYDHRVINGSYASLFLRRTKEILQEFEHWTQEV
ncbi:MAG: dihydrolipoamide acetyltransferase family protein [Flavobacteriaceae bacterium]|nr:dihydrolipoamide acetyltransferase family protein [Flavobacteriaceae bacterium]